MSLDVFVCVFTSVLLCFYVFVSERAGLFAGKTLRPFWARRRNEDSGRQHPPAGAQSREIRKKTFAFIILMSFLSEPSPIHALYFYSCFAFLSNGDEERGAAAKLAEMIGKTDHEDGKKEIFLFILDFVSVFFWELFQYLNA